MLVMLFAGSLVGAYLLGAVPFSYFAARLASGHDLRSFGTGTVSGSGVGEASGFWPMAAAGLLDIGKGVLAALPWAGSRPWLAALMAGAAVIGHNWSIFLRGAGGRGISVAGGACLVLGWEGAVALSLGLALGRLAGHTAVGSFVSLPALPLVLGLTRGPAGLLLGSALAVPMLVKRVAGNAPPSSRRPGALWFRLLHDRDRE